MLPRHTHWIAILALAMTGCASLPGMNKGNPESADNAEYNELYNGEMQVAHEAGQKEITVEEVIASGDRALATGDADRAMYEYVHALQLSGGDAGTLNKIGSIHTSLGNYQLAARAYVLSLRLDAGNPTALEGVGLLLLRDRRHDDAKKHLLAALESEPNRWKSHNGLGMLADLEGDHAAAATHFQQALDSSPNAIQDKARLLNNLGYSVYMSGDLDGALKYFYNAIDYNPNFERAWQNIGLVYTRQAKYNRALGASLHVMDKPEAYNNIGFLCMIDEQYDCAEYHFKKAIKLSPTYYVKAHENLDRLQILR